MAALRARWWSLACGALAAAFLASHAAALPVRAPGPQDRELVVVLHGMIRTPLSMRPITRLLEGEGYDVLAFGYSSYCCTIPELVGQLRAAIAARQTPAHARVHFVGHSMGNILVRSLLTSDSAPPRVGRVVMLAPPNQGAVRANQMAPVVGWLWKPTAGLRADSIGMVRGIPPVQGVEIGIIAARDDDTVKMPETHLDEEKEHVVVGGGHSFIMNRKEVHALTLSFLRRGTFSADTAEAQGTSRIRSP